MVFAAPPPRGRGVKIRGRVSVCFSSFRGFSVLVILESNADRWHSSCMASSTGGLLKTWRISVETRVHSYRL